MITITLQCNSLAELQRDVFDLNTRLNTPIEGADVQLKVHIDATALPSQEPMTDTVAAKTGAPSNKKARTKKEAASPPPEAAPMDTPTDEVKPDAPTATATTNVPSREDVIQALQKVSALKGLAEARNVLARFDYQRVSEVSSENSASFIKACEEAVQ